MSFCTMSIFGPLVLFRATMLYSVGTEVPAVGHHGVEVDS